MGENGARSVAAFPARLQVPVDPFLCIELGEVDAFLVDIDGWRLRIPVRLCHRPLEAMGPEWGIMAERRHRLAPLIIAGKALKRRVDQTPGGKGDAGRPVGIRGHFDEHRVLLWSEPAGAAAVLHQLTDRLVAHSLDRWIYDH